MAGIGQRELDRAARAFWALARAHQIRFVFAESCTGGLLSAVMTRIPGVSALFCGSAVVYQAETKAVWLGVSRGLLKRHGAVSPQVARALARLALVHTPAAQMAVATTGHLGPEAPAPLDGVLYVGLGWRVSSARARVEAHRVNLLSAQGISGLRLRHVRQRQAVLEALHRATAWLESHLGD